MTVHFDHARWNGQAEAMEALGRGEVNCWECGIGVVVVNEDIRVHDATIYVNAEGKWRVLCSACQKVTSR